MKRLIVTLLLCGTLLAGVLAPAVAGTTQAAPQRSHPAFFDKTRFLLHMGLAFYAFHHFVWARYKAHDFDKGAPHRTKDIVEAGIALLFAYHEVKVAYGIANGSHSATLHALISPLQKIGNAFNSAGNSFKKGNFTSATANALNGETSMLGTLASKAGYTIKDLPVAIPGVS